MNLTFSISKARSLYEGPPRRSLEAVAGAPAPDDRLRAAGAVVLSELAWRVGEMTAGIKLTPPGIKLTTAL